MGRLHAASFPDVTPFLTTTFVGTSLPGLGGRRQGQAGLCLAPRPSRRGRGRPARRLRERKRLRVKVVAESLPERDRPLPGGRPDAPGAPRLLGRFRLVLGPRTRRGLQDRGRARCSRRLPHQDVLLLGQYPKVLQEVGDRKPPPAEVHLDEDPRGKPTSKPY